MLVDQAAIRLGVTVRGTVQGVGFRPFVYRLARRHRLSGWVRNSTGQVEIEVEGPPSDVEQFVRALREEAPPLAKIAEIRTAAIETAEHLPAGAEGAFEIIESQSRPGEFQPVSPDAATCPDCLRELFDPADRRYRYPFINCTNCGPRFTIIEALPYDRPATTMRGFAMCEACRAEYENPEDRRFHAQPVACPACGPHLSLPLEEAIAALRRGRIVAVKSLGGYQLACDARDEAAVRRLRERKRRPGKPFAVMLADPDRYCEVSEPEWDLLRSPAAPIVLLRYRGGLAPAIAPGLAELGAMLPYTPLHHLLLHDFGGPLVMTSGNLSEEPIARDDAEARDRLAPIADLVLAHDRPIAARYDDSVVRWAAGARRVLRRARGLAPTPVELPHGPPVVATGAHLKAAFTVARGGQGFVGPHVGDLEHVLSVQSFEEALTRYQGLFRVEPERVACDLHPDYASSRIAERLAARGNPLRVQHHHAHMASVIAEHHLHGRVTGVVMDGVGLGTDGVIWGGEVLAGNAKGFERIAHLAEVPLPGGDLCAREGWRMAAAYGLPEPPEGVDGARWQLVRRFSVSGRAPLTTSAGRLFDAVASLLEICQVSTYEGEAAALLEAAADPTVGDWIDVRLEDNLRLFQELARRKAGRSASELAAVFHNSLARAIVDACRRAGLATVVLSGGCFQNRRLLESCFDLLKAAGLKPFANERVPANDGGLSLGQAMVALCS